MIVMKYNSRLAILKILVVWCPILVLGKGSYCSPGKNPYFFDIPSEISYFSALKKDNNNSTFKAIL
jgi:hypothetical protein